VTAPRTRLSRCNKTPGCPTRNAGRDGDRQQSSLTAANAAVPNHALLAPPQCVSMQHYSGNATLPLS
jgi:hypothetical protein